MRRRVVFGRRVGGGAEERREIFFGRRDGGVAELRRGITLRTVTWSLSQPEVESKGVVTLR